MRRALVLALACVTWACAKEPAPEATAEALYFGGDIVTMVPSAPGVEAFAVKDGRIVDMGTYQAMHDAHAGAMTRMVDLDGGALLPGVADPAQAADAAGILAGLAPGSAGVRRTIAIGEPADFVVFDRNPDTAPPDERERIRVVKIVRNGETVYRAGD
jgi:predicted amidohydrolase YtcJ